MATSSLKELSIHQFLSLQWYFVAPDGSTRGPVITKYIKLLNKEEIIFIKCNFKIVKINHTQNTRRKY